MSLASIGMSIAKVVVCDAPRRTTHTSDDMKGLTPMIYLRPHRNLTDARAPLARWSVGMLILAASLAGGSPTFAQDFPANGRAIVAVVPFSAGGPTDRVAREAVKIMSRNLGSNVVVENVGGAGGTIGTARVARAANDGYTILIHNIGVATAPSLYPKLGFNPMTDLEPIGELVDVPMILVGNQSVPASNTTELLEYLRAKGGNVAFGNAGVGSAAHLCGLLFLSRFKLDTLPIAYKGSAPALSDLVGGHTQIGCDQTTNLAGHLRAGTVKSFAAMQDRRVEAFKDIPTAAEQGITGVNVRVWHAVFAPKGTPKHILKKLEQALQEAVQDAEFKRNMIEVGAQAVAPTRATQISLRNHLQEQVGMWGPIIRQAGAHGD